MMEAVNIANNRTPSTDSSSANAFVNPTGIELLLNVTIVHRE